MLGSRQDLLTSLNTRTSSKLENVAETLVCLCVATEPLLKVQKLPGSGFCEKLGVVFEQCQARCDGLHWWLR